MNKIFTSLLLLAAAFTASAQNFTITDHEGNVYKDGDAINVGYVLDDGDYYWDPGLTVTINQATSALAGTSNLKVTASASTPGVIQFCGIYGSCTILNNDPVTRDGNYNVGEVVPLEIDIKMYPFVIEKPIATTVVITDGVETATITLNFLTEEAGIHGVTVADNSLRVNGRTVSFSFDKPTAVTLYNISGRPVFSRSLNGAGTLNLANIPAGVYVYSCGKETGKLLLH